MKNTKLNTQQICSVKKVINQKNTYYVFREQKHNKFLGFTTSVVKEGFYELVHLSLKFIGTEQQLLEYDKEVIVIDKQVYYKPHLKFTMSNKEVWHKFFNSIESLNGYLYSSELESVKWIQ